MPSSHPSIDQSVRDAFTAGGLLVTAVGRRFSNAGQILTATGWHPDRTPFAFVSAPFNSDPVARARQAAADLVVAHSGQRTTRPMGKLETVSDRMHAIKAKFETRADALLKRIDDIDRRGEEAFARHEAVLAANEADLDALEASLAQLSNGGPPLGNSPEPSEAAPAAR